MKTALRPSGTTTACAGRTRCTPGCRSCPGTGAATRRPGGRRHPSLGGIVVIVEPVTGVGTGQVRVFPLRNARRGPQRHTALGPESSIPPTGYCRSCVSRGEAGSGSRGSRLCDRGPPSFKVGSCGTRAALPLARAILMAPTPLVLTSCTAFDYGPTGSRRRTTVRRSSPTASFFLPRHPLCERKAGPAVTAYTSVPLSYRPPAS